MPCFFVCIECWGFHPKPGHKKLFEKSFLELQKLCKNKVVYSVRKFCGFLRSFFKSSLKQGLERSSNTFWQYKKRGEIRVFCVRYELGLSAPNPDTKDFSGKVLWNLKSFAQVKWCFGAKFFGTPFSERKVCYSVFMEYPMPRIVDMIFIPNFSSSFSLRYLI